MSLEGEQMSNSEYQVSQTDGTGSLTRTYQGHFGYDIDIPGVLEEYAAEMLELIIVAHYLSKSGQQLPAIISFKAVRSPNVRVILQVGGRIDMIGKYSSEVQCHAEEPAMHEIFNSIAKYRLFEH